MFLFQVAFLVAVLQVYPTYAVGDQACTLVEISCGKLKSRDGGYVYLYNITGVLDIAVFNNNGTAIANSGGDKPMEVVKNEVVTMNNSALTLYKCQNLKMNFIYIDSTQQKAGTESNGKEPPVKESCSHYIVKDGDNPDTNRGDTGLNWIIIVVVVVIAGLLLVLLCVHKPWRDKQRNQGHRDVEEGQGNPEPISIPLMQNEQRDARVNGQTDDAQLLGQPQSNGCVPYRRESHLTDGAPGQGAGETSPLFCRSPVEEGVLEGEDRKPTDSGGTYPESCQKTHAEPPDIRVNDKTKEQTPDAQSPGPPQMNGRPPMSNRVAKETTGLLDKQALDKDQVSKPELIDKGPNDMESRTSGGRLYNKREPNKI
ncbi:hypothetical protein J4Q44_G00177570 [Coregonus suidteri]|uniref:Uncharacterized protein n=1 Tax=Coregonus suidteri TaxID=861788 RepID=A0AAN8QV87_9TELE